MLKKIRSSSLVKWGTLIAIGLGLLAALYLVLGPFYFCALFFTTSIIGLGIILYEGVDLGSDTMAALVHVVLVLIVFGTGWQGYNIYQNTQAQDMAQYQATVGPWLSAHTALYQVNITMAKVWDSKTCNWLTGCADIKNENVTITLPDGHILAYKYSCDYFTLGQQVKVEVSPKWPYTTAANPVGIINSGNSSYGYMTHAFGYRLLTPVPSGC